MTNKQTSTKTPDMTRILQKNNKLIKGNMKMNAELIEAISALSKAVQGLQTGDSSSATPPGLPPTNEAICSRESSTQDERRRPNP
jgi:hypothetical protein